MANILDKRKTDAHIYQLQEKIDKQSEKLEMLLKIKTTVNSIDQSIDEVILPLLKKHDRALYSRDGTNGLCRDVASLQEKVKNQANQLKGMGAALLAVCVRLIIEFFTKK